MSLYVDDLLITGSDIDALSKFKVETKAKFDMTDLGPISYFVGLQITQLVEGIQLSRRNYVYEMLKRFGISQCKPILTPLVVNDKLIIDSGIQLQNPSIYRSLIGSLLYVCSSRPYIMSSLSFLSRFM